MSSKQQQADPSFEGCEGFFRPASAVDVYAMWGAAPQRLRRVGLLLALLAGVAAPTSAGTDYRPNASPLPELWGVARQRLVPLADLLTSPPPRDRHRRHRLARDSHPARSGDCPLGRASSASRPNTHLPQAAGDCRRCTRHVQRLPKRASRQPLCALGVIALLCPDTCAVRRGRPRGRPPLESRLAPCSCACAQGTNTHHRPSRQEALSGEAVATRHQGGKLAAPISTSLSRRAARGGRWSRDSLRVLDRSGATSLDHRAPTAPRGLEITQKTQTTLALSWKPSYDNRGVAGYGIYENNALVESSPSRGFTFSGLRCGTHYGLAVDAYDLAGRRSPRISTRRQTLPCSAPVPPPPPSTTPPRSNDTIAFPRIAQYDSFNWDGQIASHFQLNGFQGCNPHTADVSYALNSRQANFIIPTIPISPDGVACWTQLRGKPAGTGFAVSYGA